RRFVEDLLPRLAALPGVQSVALGNILPSGNGHPQQAFEGGATPQAAPANPVMIGFRAITPELLSTLRIPILSGRGFTSADHADSQPVGIISRPGVQRDFAGVDP